MPTVAFSRTGWFLLLLTTQVVLAGLAVGWYEVFARTDDDAFATALAIGRGLEPFVVISIVTTVIVVEGTAMLAERYFQERYERGRQKGLEEGIEKGLEEGIEKGLEQGHEKSDRAWRAWYERMRAAQAEGKPFDEPPPVWNGKAGD